MPNTVVVVYSIIITLLLMATAFAFVYHWLSSKHSASRFAMRAQAFIITVLGYSISSYLNDPIKNITEALNSKYPSIPIVQMGISFWQLVVVIFSLHWFWTRSSRNFELLLKSKDNKDEWDSFVKQKKIPFQSVIRVYFEHPGVTKNKSNSTPDNLTAENEAEVVEEVAGRKSWVDCVRPLACEYFHLVRSTTKYNDLSGTFFDPSTSIEVFLLQTEHHLTDTYQKQIKERIEQQKSVFPDYKFHFLTRAGLKVDDHYFSNSVAETRLFSSIASMPEYSRRLSHQLERPLYPDGPPISGTLVEIGCASPGARHSSIQHLLMEWFRKNLTDVAMVLIGDYGQGKSTALMLACHSLLGKSDETVPIPLFFRLSGMDAANRSAQSLLSEWMGEYQISTDVASYVLNSGRGILVLDGFDEIDMRGGSSSLLAAFNKLFRIAEVFPVRIILAGRGKLFESIQERRNALRETSERVASVTLDFLTPQTAKDLFARINPNALEGFSAKLETNDQVFWDLARRPIVLVQMAILWEEINDALAKNGNFTSVVVRSFIDSVFNREYSSNSEKLKSAFLSEGEVRFLSYAIAREVGRSNVAPAGLVAETVRGALQRLPKEVTLAYRYNEYQEAQSPVERVAEGQNWLRMTMRDFLTRGVVERDAFDDNRVRFSHKSFSEYFRAEMLAYELFGYAPDARREKLLSSLEARQNSQFGVITATIEELLFCADLMSEAVSEAVKRTDIDSARAIFFSSAKSSSSGPGAMVVLLMRHRAFGFDPGVGFAKGVRRFLISFHADNASLKSAIGVFDWSEGAAEDRFHVLELHCLIIFMVALKHGDDLAWVRETGSWRAGSFWPRVLVRNELAWLSLPSKFVNELSGFAKKLVWTS